jgi:polyferredoxin
MEKMGYPKGLIRYSTENALKGHYSADRIVKRVLRPRVLVYSGVLWIIIIAALVTLYNRVPLKVDVIRDRGNVMRDADEQEAENVYRLQVMNTQEVEREVRISVSGLDGIELKSEAQPIRVAAASSHVIPVRVEAPRAAGHKGSNRIQFLVEATDPATPTQPPIKVVEKASFVIP